MLDTENPRFVILQSREQADIRKYLVTYEDVCQLATDINTYGRLLPGERIVALHEGDKYVVVEGNRRTCSLQMLLNRELIPDGFAHRIPHTSASILTNCSNIEVDILSDRNSALELMTKRHIDGVKQWKPLAKKQFEETVTTRNVLTDVEGIHSLLQAVVDAENNAPEDDPDTPPPQDENGTEEPPADEGGGHPPGDTPPPADHGKDTPAGNSTGNTTGGPRPGGPSPRSFFETISWHGKLDPANQQHQGLLYAINELYRLSNTNCGRHKAYESFPIASGMILRTVYEQALRLRLMQVNLWGAYCQTRNNALPTLKTMEDFINAGTNKTTVFPDQGMVLTYDRVIAATHRDFLNANIHYPGNINVTAASLEAIAAGGMFALIQGIIKNLQALLY